MKKKMAAMLLVLSLMGTLAGCSASGGSVGNKAEQKYTGIAATPGGDSKADSGMEFIYATQDSVNPYSIQVYDGFQPKCAELGTKTQILGSKYDVATQVSYVEDAIQRDVDGVMISPLDENALETVVGQAKEKGIAVPAKAQSVSNAQIDGSLDEYNTGYIVGNAAAEWIKVEQGGKGRALILAQDDVEVVIQRRDGINDGILENASEAEVVARQNASNTDLGMKVMESTLLAKLEVNVICACDDFTAIGVYEAVSAMQKIPDNFCIGGCDATDEEEEKMEVENSVYRSFCNLFPHEAGEDLVETMYKYLTEKQEDVVVQRRYEPVWQRDVVGNQP